VPTPREQLGAKLRDLRRRAGLSGDQLAAQAGLSQSKVSRIETGRSLPAASELEVWGRLTGASHEELQELAASVQDILSSTEQATSWRILHRLGLTEKQREIAELERLSTRLQVFQPVMVPGLLQIADYARRVMSMGYIVAESDIARAVATRIDRQTILYDTDKSFEFVITEGALLWRPGPMELMRAQLDRLVSVASMPNISLSVCPLGEASMPFLHPFVIFEMERETLVTAETYTSELQVREAHDLERYRQVWSALTATAKTGEEALEMIRGIAGGA
jgi:transcriptional regulator with XRE-family HTH domain